MFAFCQIKVRSPMEIEFDTQTDINYSDSFFEPPQKSETALHENIPVSLSSARSLVSHRISRFQDLSVTDRKTQTIVSCRKTMKVGGSGEVAGTWSWGDPDGSKFSGYGRAEVHDDRGNYARVEVEQKSDGRGNVSASTGHKGD